MKIPRCRSPLGLSVSLLLLGPWLYPATGQLLGPEFQINSSTGRWQRGPAVAAGTAGSFVVVWQSNHLDHPSYQVFGQRFNTAGARLGSEFAINNGCCGENPTLAVDSAGNFVVAWNTYLGYGSNEGVFGRRFNSVGIPTGSAFQVNTYTPGAQQYPAAASTDSGNFVVVWESVGANYSSYDVFGQRFNSAGSKLDSEFRVSPLEGGWSPKVAANLTGKFLVVWGGSDGSMGGPVGQRFSSAGAKLGPSFQINSYTTEDQGAPAVTADGSGNFIVVWDSVEQDGSGRGVFGQRFDSTGSRLGSEFRVNSASSGNQYRPAVAADEFGNFLVVWESSVPFPDTNVFAQRFDSSGSRIGSEFRVNSYTTDRQGYAAVAALGPGNFVVTWESQGQDGANAGIFGQRVTSAVTGCVADGDTLCLNNSRFRVEVDWRNYAGQTGSGQAVPFRNDSGLFWFFGPSNIEMLIKVINGCGFNQRYWVYAAATTDVEYRLTVTDTTTEISREYSNVLGNRAAAITDSSAFATCGGSLGDDPPLEFASGELDELAESAEEALGQLTPIGSTLDPLSTEALCTPGNNDLCLGNNRFRIRITWRDYNNHTGSGWAVPYTNDSGMFWFFGADNIEFLVKVVNGCGLNSKYWVYAAATTDVEYTMTVTDTLRNVSKAYTNPLGTASPAITDSSAFATCP